MTLSRHLKKKRFSKDGSLNNIGLTYQKLNNFEKAIENFENALKYRDLKTQDPYLYARIIDNIAYTKFLRGDTIGIVGDLYKSLRIRDSLKYISGTVVSKRHLSEYFTVKKDSISAIKLAEEAYDLAGQVDNNRDKLATLLLLSKVDSYKSSKYLKEYVKDTIQDLFNFYGRPRCTKTNGNDATKVA